MKEMSFEEYLIRTSFPELSDEEVEKILKRIREEGREVGRNVRERNAQFGFYEDGEPRFRLPRNFWEKQEWIVPNQPDEKDYPFMCVRDREIGKMIMRRFPKVTLNADAVHQWFHPSHKDTSIPGVYRTESRFCGKETWVHRDIVRQMAEKLENDPQLIWEKPEVKHEVKQEPIQLDEEEAKAESVQINPVSIESIILQRIGGLKGNVQQQRQWTLKIKNEVERVKSRTEKLEKLLELVMSWVEDNFQVGFCVDNAQFTENEAQ